MIVDSYAIVDPWAVMVKSFNALVASVAMPRSRGPNNQAIRA